MTERVEITEGMIAAATTAGKATGALAPTARHADVRRMLAASVAVMPEEIRAARFDMIVNVGFDRKKARFMGAGAQRGYLYVECEDGQRLHVHANEIEPLGRQR